MDLFENMNDDEIIGKKKKSNKTMTIIIIAIISILIIIIAIVGVIAYLKSLTMKFYIDGVSKTIDESYFQITEDGKIYVSIQDMANLLRSRLL